MVQEASLPVSISPDASPEERELLEHFIHDSQTNSAVVASAITRFESALQPSPDWESIKAERKVVPPKELSAFDLISSIMKSRADVYIDYGDEVHEKIASNPTYQEYADRKKAVAGSNRSAASEVEQNIGNHMRAITLKEIAELLGKGSLRGSSEQDDTGTTAA